MTWFCEAQPGMVMHVVMMFESDNRAIWRLKIKANYSAKPGLVRWVFEDHKTGLRVHVS